MSTAELDDIIEAVEAALRRAYALGRQDALDRLTRYIQSDEVVSQRLALAAPTDGPSLAEGGAEHAPTSGGTPDSGDAIAASPGSGADHAYGEGLSTTHGGADPGPAGSAQKQGERRRVTVVTPRRPAIGMYGIGPSQPGRGSVWETIRDLVYPARLD